MRQHSPIRILSSLALAAVTCLPSAAIAADGNKGADVFVQHNLVSDLPGMADHTDANLVNAWGLAHSPSGPWWVNANGTGLSIIYDTAGVENPTVNPVMIPASVSSGTGTPTGIVFNNTINFQLAPVMPALFLFASEDGTISGWNPGVDAHHAVIKVNRGPSAVYKGITIARNGEDTLIYAANFRTGAVDVFDTNFHPVTMRPGAFMDLDLPFAYAPFNVQSVDGSIFVTFAAQDSMKHDDVAGPGNGFVDQFTTDGRLMNRLEHGPWMNSPWAVVQAPGNFGKMSQRLLVGNFGSGQIAAFDAQSGKFQSMLNGQNGNPLTIDGLWGLSFGNGFAAGPANVLFFSAGIQDEAHGLFGTLIPSSPATTSDDTDNSHNHGHN